jgi:hypothetical protein
MQQLKPLIYTVKNKQIVDELTDLGFIVQSKTEAGTVLERPADITNTRARKTIDTVFAIHRARRELDRAEDNYECWIGVLNDLTLARSNSVQGVIDSI